jgi:hypothetical protein
MQDRSCNSAPVWAIDMVKVKPGELDHYVSFIRQNWLSNREQAARRKVILSYKMVLSKPDEEGAKGPDVMLMTEYPSEQAYADREKIFEPILKARTRVLVDGRTGRDFVQSMTSVSGIDGSR